MATSSARYRVHVDLDYEGKHAEAGSIVSNLPSTSVAWLKSMNYITLIPKGGKAEDYPQLDPRTGAPVSPVTPTEPGVEEQVAADAVPASADEAHPDPSSESPAGVPSPGAPADHPALATPEELAEEHKGKSKKEKASTRRDEDSEQLTAVPDEPPPESEPPAKAEED